MPTVDVFNIQKKKVGSVELDDAVFAVPVREHLFYTMVRYQRAKARSGNHATKGRAQVSGGGKKPWRQKGTGRARQGSSRSPHWAGGGVVHGPHPRSHAHDLPKKVRRAALASALSRRVGENALFVFDAFELEGIKTRNFMAVMKAFGVESFLLVLPEKNDAVSKSARNIPGVTVLPVAGLNVLDILKHKHIAITQDTIALINRKVKGQKSDVEETPAAAPAPKKARAKTTTKKSAGEGEVSHG